MEVRVPTERVLLWIALRHAADLTMTTRMAMVAKVAMTRAAVATAETPKAATSNEYSARTSKSFDAGDCGASSSFSTPPGSSLSSLIKGSSKWTCVTTTGPTLKGSFAWNQAAAALSMPPASAPGTAHLRRSFCGA